MSRIFLSKTAQNSEPYGWSAPVVDDSCPPAVSRDLDFEILPFILKLIEAVDGLCDDEALVIWKEIN
jgi:hypothetical protein